MLSNDIEIRSRKNMKAKKKKGGKEKVKNTNTKKRKDKDRLHNKHIQKKRYYRYKGEGREFKDEERKQGEIDVL